MPDCITTLVSSDALVENREKRLSICLRSNGFSFSVCSAAEDDVLYQFGQAQCDFAKPLGQLAASLKGLFAQLEISPFDFKQMSLVCPSSCFAWVPCRLYNPAMDRRYLSLLAKVDAGEGVFRCFVPNLDSYIVFTASPEVANAFKLALPGIDLCCQHSALVNSALLAKSEQRPVILMNVRDGVGDFEALFNGRLLLSNTFPASTDDELLYHALGIMKRLRIETPDLELSICGAVSRDLFALLGRYFPNVTLSTGRKYSFVSSNFDSFHIYKHALLLS